MLRQQIVLFTELRDIIVVIVTNTMFILPWVHEKFTVKFTMLNVDGHTIYNNNRLAALAVLSDPKCLSIDHRLDTNI